MKTKSIAGIFLALLALTALLGCVEEQLPAAQCAGESQPIPVIASPPECCAGLTLILPKEEAVLGISGYCTAKCGNGSCDEIESSYNCPEDCTEAQAIGPDYYDSESQAFDALEAEIKDMESLSTEDLEGLLGE